MKCKYCTIRFTAPRIEIQLDSNHHRSDETLDEDEEIHSGSDGEQEEQEFENWSVKGEYET